MCQLQTICEVLCLFLLSGGLRLCTAEVFQQCASVEVDTFIMAIDDCTSYIYCNGENSFRDSCPDQTYFDANAQECAFDDTGICLDAMKTTTVAALEEMMNSNTDAPMAVPTETDTDTEQTKPGDSRPHCDTSGDGYHPHPERCEYYYSCIAGYLTIVRCPYNYGWDYAHQQCKPLSEAQCYSL